MEKWFEPKFEKNYRRYTKRRLQSNNFERAFRRFSITTWVIIVNIVVFIFVSLLFPNQIMQVDGENVLTFHPFVKENIALGASFLEGRIWTPLTSMFMHGGFTHLFLNMVSLFFIGSFVERLIGRKRFFWLYILSGLFAGLFFISLAYLFGANDFGARIFGSLSLSAVGASGAIFAIAGLLAVLTPKLRVYVFFIIPMQMWIAVLFLLVILWVASIGAGLPFGNTAHFGGLLVGVVYAVYLKKKYKRKTAMISRYFSH